MDEIDIPDSVTEQEREFIMRATVSLGTLYLADQVKNFGKGWIKQQMAEWLAKELPKLRKEE